MGGLLRFNWIIVGIILLKTMAAANAHVFEVCLHRLADDAAALKSCRIKQSASAECDAIHQQFEIQRQQCVAQEFTRAHMSHAIEYGESQVQGEVDQSPYNKRVRQQQKENRQMGPNIANFEALFPHVSKHLGKVRDNFNTRRCKDQYEGRYDRWMFIQRKEITQFSLPGSQTPTTTVPVYFFAREKAGQCYSPDPADGKYQVVNIPELMLLEMEQVPDIEVTRCLGSRCQIDLSSLSGLYEQYQQQYREYEQLAVCADMDLKNSQRKLVKGKKRPERQLPDYCPEDEIHVKALNARGALVELSDRLFGPISAAPN